MGTMPLPVGFSLPHHDAVGEAHFGAAATAIADRGGVKGAAFNAKAIEEILKTNNLIYETTGRYPQYMRPPFGAWKKNLELRVEMMPVFWTIDTLDWKVQNTEQIIKTVEEKIKDGSIILMHDEYKTTVEAALRLADSLKEKGYELVTVDELIMP